jgi:tetratricopeptide (TPR) repeat protein
MQPTGKPEKIQCQMAFYFTDKPTSKTMIKIGLADLGISIPAGDENHIVEDKFVLPVDADVLALMPHAHYLGKELRGFAILPDGTKKTLLEIKQWDFNWQNDYRFKTPVSLPKGSTIAMQYSYDNSTNNVRNPNHPPKPVQYGIQTTDEMGELWIQLELRGTDDLPPMEKALAAKIANQNIIYNQYRLRLNPNDAEAQAHLGELYSYAGRKAEALEHLQKAIRLNPNYDEPHYHLGLIYRVDKQLDRARDEFETAIRLNPKNSRAHGNLGFIFASIGEIEAAQQHLRIAIQLNPNDNLALGVLKQLEAAKSPGAK